MAGVGRFEYATDHSGALVLGNLLCAVMMRNELFLRFLYLIANTFFAKVGIYSRYCWQFMVSDQPRSGHLSVSALR
jgi:hypothetical protein